MKKLFIAILFSFLLGQDDLLDVLNEGEDQFEYVESAFKSTRVANAQSLEIPKPKILQFMIQHRFGSIENGFYDLFGTDYAIIRYDFNYGFNDLLAAGFSADALQKAGVSIKDLVAAGLSAEELLAAGISLKDLIAAGVDTEKLKALGFSDDEINSAAVGICTAETAKMYKQQKTAAMLMRTSNAEIFFPLIAGKIKNVKVKAKPK